MSNNLEQFNTEMKRVALTTAEKAHLRKQIVSFMDAHPMTEGAQSIVSPYAEGIAVRNGSSNVPTAPKKVSWSVFFHQMKVHYVPLSLIVVLLFGSAVSAAAEETVPGDALYFVKTNINESVKGWLALSHESKVRLEGQVALDRIEEAEKLSVQKKLSPQVKTDLEEKFKTHADAFKAGVKELESQGKYETAAGVSSKFESSLNGHENVLSALGGGSTTTDATLVQSMALKVKAEASAVSGVRATIEDRVQADATAGMADATSTEAAAREALKTTEDNVILLNTILDASKAKLTTKALNDAKDEMTYVSTIITKGNDRMDDKDYANAFLFYQKADRVTQELKITLETNNELELDTNDLTSGSGTATTTAATSTPGLPGMGTTTATSTIKTSATSTGATTTPAGTTTTTTLKLKI